MSGLLRLVAAAGLAVSCGFAAAQAYPAKAVRLIVGQSPGGATDIFARIVAQKMSEAWKQPVVVENRSGAAGAIGAELTVKAPPDGYTLLLATAGQIVINPHFLIAVLPHVKAGRLRALAVSTSHRSQSAPDVPTVAEAGVPGYDFTTWYGFFGPAALPRDLAGRINAEVTRILGLADVRERLTNDGTEPGNLTPEQFVAFIRAEAARWSKLIRTMNIRPD